MEATNPIARPVPIATEDREFIAEVERWVPDALLENYARESAPSGVEPAQLARQMAAAEPGDRLRTAVEVAMRGSRHFANLPPAEWSAAAEQASLAAAQVIDSSLTVERSEPTSRLGKVAGRWAGKALDAAFSGAYRDIAQHAAHATAEKLSGAINWSHFEQNLETQRRAGAVAPAAGMPAPSAATKSKAPGTTAGNNLGPIERG